MKKWMMFAAAGVLAASMASCKAGGNSPSGSEGTVEASTEAGGQAEAGKGESKPEESQGGEEEVEIPNPFQELEGPEGLKELQLSMEAPEGADNIQYFSIDNEIGEIDFELDGHRYVYRGAVHAEDFSGIFEEFEPEGVAVSDIGADEDLVIKTTVSGGRLAKWAKGGAKYTLYTPDAVEDGKMIELCSSLIEKN